MGVIAYSVCSVHYCAWNRNLLHFSPLMYTDSFPLSSLASDFGKNECMHMSFLFSDHVSTRVLVGAALPCLRWPFSAVLATCLSEVPPPLRSLAGMQKNCVVIAITVY